MQKNKKNYQNKEAHALMERYKRVFATPDGQLVLKDLKRRCGLETPIYQVGMDGLSLANADGRQETIKYILRMLKN